MKSLKQYDVREMSLSEIKTVEGGFVLINTMHIYFPEVPEIRRWNPFKFNNLNLWS